MFWVAVGLERGPLNPCEDKWRTTWNKSSGSGLKNWDERPQGIRRADHSTPRYPQKLALNFVDKRRSLSRCHKLVKESDVMLHEHVDRLQALDT
jgi:hypothetical protein